MVLKEVECNRLLLQCYFSQL